MGKNMVENAVSELSSRLPLSVATVMSKLESAGFEAFVVGGCVRDAILERDPHDWDVTTNALPSQMKEAIPYPSFDTGIEHGTVTFLVDGDAIEVTTYRLDGCYSDGRHPDSVEFVSNVEEDLSRRDFTVNAMAWSPDRGFMDFFDGIGDLEKGKLRCVGEPHRRFEEDGLRVMRALRFAAVYGFEIENATAEAVHDCAHMLDKVARERVNGEMVKMLSAPDGWHLAWLLEEFHDVVFRVIPEIEVMYGYDQNNVHHDEDLWNHTLRVLATVESRSPKVRLAALLHDAGKPQTRSDDEDGNSHYYGHMVAGREMTVSIMENLKFSRDDIDEVSFMVGEHDARPSDTRKSVRRFIAKCSRPEMARDLITLMIADASAHCSDKALASASKLRNAREMMEEEFANDALFSMKDMDFSGKDLIEMGWEPGPAMGEELRRLFALVVDGKVENEKEKIAVEVADLPDSGK